MIVLREPTIASDADTDPSYLYNKITGRKVVQKEKLMLCHHGSVHVQEYNRNVHGGMLCCRKLITSWLDQRIECMGNGA